MKVPVFRGKTNADEKQLNLGTSFVLFITVNVLFIYRRYCCRVF
jgi:hypothetical protein